MRTGARRGASSDNGDKGTAQKSLAEHRIPRRTTDGPTEKARREPASPPFALELPRQRPTLPRRYQRSTIGPGGLNFRVRDGNGCGPSGNATGNRMAIEYVDSRVQPSDVVTYECNVVKPHGRLVPLG